MAFNAALGGRVRGRRSRHVAAYDICVGAEPIPHMTFYELAFRLQHDCPYSEFSKNNPSVVISHWCNWSKDVFEFAYPAEESGSTKLAIRSLLQSRGAKVIRRSSGSPNLQVVLQHCACGGLPPPTLPTIEKHNCLNLQPMVYTEGWEWYHITAFSGSDLRALFKELERNCRIEVTSKRSFPKSFVHENCLVSTGSLLGDLTKLQARALIGALDNGYYNFPRVATSEEIAQRLGIPRTSFGEHLRKGENKVIRAVSPYVRMLPTAKAS